MVRELGKDGFTLSQDVVGDFGQGARKQAYIGFAGAHGSYGREDVALRRVTTNQHPNETVLQAGLWCMDLSFLILLFRTQ